MTSIQQVIEHCRMQSDFVIEHCRMRSDPVPLPAGSMKAAPAIRPQSLVRPAAGVAFDFVSDRRLRTVLRAVETELSWRQHRRDKRAGTVE
jgi:hypothetical protein